MTKRIAVVGVGAIGGAVAADLSDLGRHEIVLCTRAPIERLEVRHPGGRSTVPGPSATPGVKVDAVDWVLLATKAHQSDGARPWLAALCGSGTRVAVLQNGVDHVERITPLVPPHTEVVPVVIQLPAEKVAPGRVEQSRDGTLLVPDHAGGRALAALFDGARTELRVVEDFTTAAWWKLVSNASLGAVCALVLRENGVAEAPEVREVVMRLMREVIAVGRAEGAALPDDAAEQSLARVLAVAGGHWSSITVDRREGRPMEWAVRNAVVGRLGRRHGIPTPWNDAFTALLKAADPAAAAPP